jgi:hypothetical protein
MHTCAGTVFCFLGSVCPEDGSEWIDKDGSRGGCMSLGSMLRTSVSIVIVACLTVALACAIILVLNMLNLIAFTGGGWLVATSHTIRQYLGTSVIFFVLDIILFCLMLTLLRSSLNNADSEQTAVSNIIHYNNGVDICIGLFFGIGVLYTSWGISHALTETLGKLSAQDAERLGAWQILSRLTHNGLLVALWTTIIGGVGGYCMRVIRFFVVGRGLARLSAEREQTENAMLFSCLHGIRQDVQALQQGLQTPAQDVDGSGRPTI